jgi:hypothetical protein
VAQRGLLSIQTTIFLEAFKLSAQPHDAEMFFFNELEDAFELGLGSNASSLPTSLSSPLI